MSALAPRRLRRHRSPSALDEGELNGHYEANDLSSWLASNPVDVLAANLHLPRQTAEKLRRRPRFAIPGARSPAA
ncbi:hypothetical protein [Bosea sp. F3-2]|uniref:hypothetical protein n=1 Tax=Bosea sp. F3-2 TaxID=2599640 RepID=UPI0020BFF66A|nr:hypothetical protein [Bosea sp. F3-2]